MGCDIHLYVEQKIDLLWVSKDKWSRDIDYSDLDVDYKDSFYHTRNYNVFAMLADVRNGTGFAGTDTGEGFKPIADQRGFPDDCDPLLKQHRDNYGIDGHSDSWLTLAELKAYDWYGQKSRHRGYVQRDQYLVFKNKGKPEEYCGNVWSWNNVRKYESAGEYEKVMLYDQDPDNTYINVEWYETYAESAETFLTEAIPKLEKLLEHKDDRPEDIRIVFFFDN